MSAADARDSIGRTIGVSPDGAAARRHTESARKGGAAVAVFTIGSTNIVQGAERHGAAQDPPDRVVGASVQLVDTDGVWDTASGTIIRWGVQASASDGTFSNTPADWQNQGSIFQDNLPFGSRDRQGGMPKVLVQSFGPDGAPLPVAPAGVKLRLAIQVTATIKLGAEIRTNADV